jgi:D-amino peptidase
MATVSGNVAFRPKSAAMILLSCEVKGWVLMSFRQNISWLVSFSLALFLGHPAAAQGFKIYISTDMEGCSGITSSKQVAAEEGKQLMAGDMNACIEGCFAAGATEVVVRDHHGGGRNVNPQSIDRRAKLIQGATPGKRFKDIEGSAALILLGYHAKALTPGGTLAHSYSSASIQGMWLNGREVGEIGVDAAIAAEHKVPVVMVSGDDKVCAEARSWLPGVVTCQTKKGTGPQSADLIPLEESRRLVTQKTKEALAKRQEIRPIEWRIGHNSMGLSAQRIASHPRPGVQAVRQSKTG